MVVVEKENHCGQLSIYLLLRDASKIFKGSLVVFYW